MDASGQCFQVLAFSKYFPYVPCDLRKYELVSHKMAFGRVWAAEGTTSVDVTLLMWQGCYTQSI